MFKMTVFLTWLSTVFMLKKIDCTFEILIRSSCSVRMCMNCELRFLKPYLKGLAIDLLMTSIYVVILHIVFSYYEHEFYFYCESKCTLCFDCFHYSITLKFCVHFWRMKLSVYTPAIWSSIPN